MPSASPSAPSAATLAVPIALMALVGGAVAMGASPVFVRFAEVGPFVSAFWRVGLALPALLIWAIIEQRRAGRPLFKALRFDRAVLLAGLFFVGDLTFWHVAILNTTIANATLLSCLAPVWVVLLSGTFIGEPVDRRVFYGLALCLVGAAFLIGENMALAPERLKGDLAGVATSFFFGLYFLAMRVARRTHSAGTATFLSACITASGLLIVALIGGGPMWPQTTEGVQALLALSLFSQVIGQGLLSVALGALSAAFGSLVIFVEALAAAVLGWAVLDETISLVQAAGGALILSGIWIARPRKQPDTVSPAAPVVP
ncbi:DMT family transporter [Rhizobiaceae bacterium]|nr:DMT family transporter [Rhizobiaceae bacterium]